MSKRLLVSDTRWVPLTDQAATYFVAQLIATPVTNPDHDLVLSSEPPWDARPIRKLLLFLGGHDVSHDD